MSDLALPDEGLLRRLPLPLAQLARRAYNAKTPLERHLTAFYLWEAALKLLSSAAIVSHAHHSRPEPILADRLRNLARPALGHWWEFARLLVPSLAESGQEHYAAPRNLLLGGARDDLPRAAGLDAVLREELEGKAGARTTVRLTELFDRLVAYRNKHPGHGAVGRLPEATHRRIGAALLAGVGEILDRLDVLAGQRLVHVGEVRQTGGVWLVERFELTGESPRRIASLELPREQADRVPDGGRLYLAAPGIEGPEGLTPLYPLLLYDAEAEEVQFLNARRGKQRAEYLGYTTGRTTPSDLGGIRLEMLARILGTEVRAVDVDAWEARSQAEEPGVRQEPEEATRLLGEFQLLSELGRGGMGIVYRAWQPSLGRQVAVKKLQRTGDPRSEARFSREIRALGRAEHPHLVKVFTSGSDGDQWFYAMELIEGTDLASVCAQLGNSTASEVSEEDWTTAVSTAREQQRQRETPISDGQGDRETRRQGDKEREGNSVSPSPAPGRNHIRRVVELVRQAAEAAQALHQAGVIHRDVKPGNILLSEEGGHAVLMDLGLAQMLDESEGRLTRTRQFVGTLRYASPEQIMSVKLDPRTDVYSLGATLWELLTLRPLFGVTEQTPTPELMLKIQMTDAERVRKHNPRVPSDLEAVVTKCLEKDRTRRYGSAGELAADLDRWLRGEPVQAQPPSLRYLLGKKLRREKLRLTAIAGAVLAVVLGTVAALTALALLRIDRAREEAEEANERATQSLKEAKEARELSDQRARELRDQAVQLDVLSGNRLMDEGDPLGAMLWFADALRIDAGDPERELPHRVRLGALYLRCPKVVQFWQHPGVTCAALSDDGRYAASGGEDKLAHVWNVETGEKVAEVSHEGRVNRVVFSPDGRYLATAAEDKRGRLYELKSGRTIELTHQGPVNAIAFSGDSTLVVTGSADKTALVWKVTTGERVGEPHRHTDAVLCAGFSPDGKWIVTGSADRNSRIRDLSGKLGRTFDHEGAVIQVSFSLDGQHLLVVDDGGSGQSRTAKVYDAAMKDLIHTISGQPGKATGAGFSPDGRRVVVTTTAGAFVTDLESGGGGMRELHSAAVAEAAFSPDGQMVVTAGADNTARLWDATSRMQLTMPLGHNGPVISARFAPDGRHVLTASRDGTVRFWQVAPFPYERQLVRESMAIHKADLSRDGGNLLTVTDDGTARVWDAASGKPLTSPFSDGRVAFLAVISPDGNRVVTVRLLENVSTLWDAATGKSIAPLEHGKYKLNHAVFSADSRLVATTGEDGTARVWDARTGESRLTLEEHNFTSHIASFSPDNRYLAVAYNWIAPEGFRHTTCVWDLNAKQRVGSPQSHPNVVLSLAFNPDSRRYVVHTAKGNARIWKLGGGAATPPIKHSADITFCAFSSDGKKLVTTSEDTTARIWDAATGEPLTPPLKHPGPVSNAAFSPDGRLVITADDAFDARKATQSTRSGVARVWDATTGDPVTPFLPHERHIGWVAFRPDGRSVLTASEDGTVYEWPLPLERATPREWNELAEAVSGRQFRARGGFLALPTPRLKERWDSSRLRLPQHFVTPPERLDAWHDKEAARCEAKAEWFGAAWHLNPLIEKEPFNVSLWQRRAEARAHFGNLTGSIADFSEAIRLRPTVWQPHFRRGEIHAELKDYIRAEEDYTRALDRGPGDREGDVRVRRIEANIELGRIRPAREDYEKASKLSPSGLLTRDRLAQLDDAIQGMILKHFRQLTQRKRWLPDMEMTADRKDLSYRDGEDIRFTLTPLVKGYLYLFRHGPNDQVVCLYPSKSQRQAEGEGEKPVQLPLKGAPVKFRTDGPAGRYVYAAFLTSKPLTGPPFDRPFQDEFPALGAGQSALDRMAELGKELEGRAELASTTSLDITVGPRTVGAFIGIDQYRSQRIAPLRASRRDAESMAEVMRQRGLVHEAIVRLDETATYERLARLFTQELKESTRAGDTIFLYWSGHANRVVDKGAPEGKRESVFLIPHDGDPQPEARVVTDKQLSDWLQALDGRRVFVILEANHSGVMAPTLAKRDVSVLASCSSGEEAYERPEADHSVMTYYLLEYLRGARGKLDREQMHKQVKERVLEYSRKVRIKPQTPLLLLSGEGSDSPR